MRKLFLRTMLISIFTMGTVYYANATSCEPSTEMLETTNDYIHNINFKEYKSLNAALKSASKQDKMLMLMFSADWCAPCNYMKEYVFTNKQISEFYNANFVSVYLDADKNKQFIEQVREQVGNVNALPSFLFFDKDKYFVYHFEGSQTTSDFLKKGHRALEEQGYAINTGNENSNGSSNNDGALGKFWNKVKGILKL